MNGSQAEGVKPLLTSDDGRFAVVQSQAWMAQSLERIQFESFPTLSSDELMNREHFVAHTKVFPEGQHAVLELTSGRVVASSTDLRAFVDFEHYQHKYIEAVAGNWLSNHRPDGDWLYGADIGVLPEFRGERLSTLLYRARHDLVRRLGLRGHVAGAMPKGYGQHRHLGIEAYLERVLGGELEERIINVMLRRGYQVHGVIADYLEDPSCGNYGVLMVWHNPEVD